MGVVDQLAVLRTIIVADAARPSAGRADSITRPRLPGSISPMLRRRVGEGGGADRRPREPRDV